MRCMTCHFGEGEGCLSKVHFVKGRAGCRNSTIVQHFNKYLQDATASERCLMGKDLLAHKRIFHHLGLKISHLI